MAWRRRGDKPLSEPMMVSLRRIYASLGLNELSLMPTYISNYKHYNAWDEIPYYTDHVITYPGREYS